MKYEEKYGDCCFQIKFINESAHAKRILRYTETPHT